MTKRVVAISAGLSESGTSTMLAHHMADATVKAAAADGVTIEIDMIELRPIAQEIMATMLAHQPGPALADVITRVTSADGIIVVTPTFNASYSGLFKSFFDVIEMGQLQGIPVLMGATGGSARHSMVVDHAMRPMFAYLGAIAQPTGTFAASEDWGNQDSGLLTRVARAGRELARAVELHGERAKPDPFDADAASFESFEQMMSGLA